MPSSDITPPASTIPETFAGRGPLVEVVEQSHREDDRRAEHDAERLGRRREHETERIEAPCHQHREQERREHRDATERRGGRVVHPALVGRDHSAELDREVAHERREHERGDGGNATDDEVGAQARHRTASLGRVELAAGAAELGIRHELRAERDDFVADARLFRLVVTMSQ